MTVSVILTFDPELQDQLNDQRESLVGVEILAFHSRVYKDETPPTVIKQEDVVGTFRDLDIGPGQLIANTFIPSDKCNVDISRIQITDILFLTPAKVKGNIPPLNNCVVFVEVS